MLVSGRSLTWFQKSVTGNAHLLQVGDVSDASAGGIHIAALGGLWQAAVFGFAGLAIRPDSLSLDPHLPPAWKTFGFHVHWRGRLVRIRCDQEAGQATASLVNGDAMTLDFRGERHTLRPSEALRLPLKGPGRVPHV